MQNGFHTEYMAVSVMGARGKRWRLFSFFRFSLIQRYISSGIFFAFVIECDEQREKMGLNQIIVNEIGNCNGTRINSTQQFIYNE